jgi:hypothetical protein
VCAHVLRCTCIRPALTAAAAAAQALRAGNMKTVRLKIEKLSEEERGWVDCDGRTFLHHVVMENKPKLVPVVNVLTAQAHIADQFSLTPRALAVVSGYDECASMLEARTRLHGSLAALACTAAVSALACVLMHQYWPAHGVSCWQADTVSSSGRIEP